MRLSAKARTNTIDKKGEDWGSYFYQIGEYSGWRVIKYVKTTQNFGRVTKLQICSYKQETKFR